MKYIPLIARTLFSLIFLMTIKSHFSDEAIGYADKMGVPMPSVLVPLSGIIAIVGALSIIIGYKAKWGAGLILLFLIPVTLFMHRFWDVPDTAAAHMQMVNFMKNLSMMGGALLIMFWGPGPVSIDSRP
jgi:putative oxidoreductase